MSESLPFDRRAALGLLGGASLIAAAPRAKRPTALPVNLAADHEVRVAVRGGSLYVRSNGAASGRAPILFVHGGPGSSHWYFLPALALADQRPVILYDQLDSGRSDVPNDPANWTVERFVSEIDAVRAALQLDRLHLVGVSWGAAVAIEYAARRPAGLQSVTLGGALVSTRSWEASARQRLSQLPAAVADAIRQGEAGDGTGGGTDSPEYKAAIEVYYSNFLRREPVPPAIAAYRDALPVPSNQRLYRTMWGPGETAATGSLRNYDAEPLLPRIGVPVLFLTGQYDEMLPTEIDVLARRVLRAETRVIPRAGHTAILDNPEAWLREVRRFTARHD